MQSNSATMVYTHHQARPASSETRLIPFVHSNFAYLSMNCRWLARTGRCRDDIDQQRRWSSEIRRLNNATTGPGAGSGHEETLGDKTTSWGSGTKG
ncbi:hypothetical protein Trydic_g12845 [Trypoxylus dichotomus]